MALLKCVECGADVSEYAKQCPKCGCPVEEITKQIGKSTKIRKKFSKKRILLIVIVLLVVKMFFSCSSGDNSFDCCEDIGKEYTEFTTLKFVEDEVYNTMFPDDPKIFEAKKEYEYRGIKGELTYRYFEEDDYGYSANEIYYISWSPLEEETVDKSTINYIIGWYGGYYGDYNGSEETSYDTIDYTWDLENDVTFEISVENDYSDLEMKWMGKGEN